VPQREDPLRLAAAPGNNRHDGRDPGREEPHVEVQRAFWNVWNAEARSPERLNRWTSLRRDAILRLLNAIPVDTPRIIDLGCGTGWFTERLAAYGPTTGVDLSDEVLAEAQKRAPHIRYIPGDFFHVELPAGGFDIVVSQDVIAHVTDQIRYVELAARLLEPGGYLVITTTNRFVVERMELPPQPAGHIERWLTMRQLRDLLRPHFIVLRKATVMPAGSQGLLRLINSPRLESVLSPLISPEKLSSLKEKLGFGYNLVILARKRF